MLKVILKNISPNEEEVRKVKRIVNSVKKKIIINDAKVEFGGSYAKDTWLKGMHDIDIYVKFNFEKFKNKKIDNILDKELNRTFKNIKVLHGSRNYFQIKKEGYIFEIIPILDIKSVKDAKNITDISPFHVKWVRAHYNQEIRLGKAFCKAQGCYGAESYIQGFSGYVLEILTIHYKGFLNFLKDANKWKDKTVIGDNDLIKKLDKQKKQGPLILIDPVDKNRNVAAALSKEQYNLFIKKAKEFLKKPSERFFTEKKFKIPRLKNFIVFDVLPLNGKKDIIAAKMFKAFRYLRKHLIFNGFKIKKSGWNFDNKIFWFSFENLKLSDKVKHYGPSSKFKIRLGNFKKKWKSYKLYKENDKLYIFIKRKYKDVDSFLKEFLEDKNLKKLVKTLKRKVYK